MCRIKYRHCGCSCQYHHSQHHPGNNDYEEDDDIDHDDLSECAEGGTWGF